MVFTETTIQRAKTPGSISIIHPSKIKVSDLYLNVDLRVWKFMLIWGSTNSMIEKLYSLYKYKFYCEILDDLWKTRKDASIDLNAHMVYYIIPINLCWLQRICAFANVNDITRGYYVSCLLLISFSQVWRLFWNSITNFDIVGTDGCYIARIYLIPLLELCRSGPVRTAYVTWLLYCSKSGLAQTNQFSKYFHEVQGIINFFNDFLTFYHLFQLFLHSSHFCNNLFDI